MPKDRAATAPRSSAARDKVKSFQTKGYAVFGNQISAAELDELRSVWRALAVGEPGVSRIVGNELLYRYPGLVLPLVASGQVLDLLEAVMGPFVQLDSVALVGVDVGDLSALSWHRDPYGGMPRGRAFQRPMSAHMLIYLQDMNEASGPLRVLAGSHRRPLAIMESRRNEPREEESLVHLSAGDGVIFHNNLLHSRSPNRSARPRIHFSAIYNLTCMRTTLDHEQSAIRDLRARLSDIGDPRLLRLLGEDSFADQRYNSGFLRPDAEMWRQWIAEETSA
jgi:hypothetical protein